MRYRLGGRESNHRYGGSFPTKNQALARKRWIDGELAAMRVPDLKAMRASSSSSPSLHELAEKWRASRIDVTGGTAATHRVNLGRILPRLGSKAVAEITAADVAALITELHGAHLARESIRKTRATLAMVLDFGGIQPNPARSKSVRLPHEDRPEVSPPTADHVMRVVSLLPTEYRLPTIVLDATGMRVSELEELRWRDVDEPEGRWRVSAATAKTRRSRWVPVPADVFAAVVALVPREDRDIDAQVFDGFGADRFRTALARGCKAGGIPAFSPHDLRHRRATLWHLGGVPAVQAAAWLGHSPHEHLKTYAHATLGDRAEIRYATLLRGQAASARSCSPT